MQNRIIRKIRHRRDISEFRKAYANAPANMQQELTAMATRQGFMR